LSSNFLKIIYLAFWKKTKYFILNYYLVGILEENKIFYFKLVFIWHFRRKKKYFILNYYLSGILEEKKYFILNFYLSDILEEKKIFYFSNI